MSYLGRLQKRVFGISPMETTFQRRGFPAADAEVQAHLEHAAGTFVRGYNLAIPHDRVDLLAGELNEIDSQFRGFAFEGAAMALALLDRLTPWKRDRWREFLEGPGDSHAYMLHVGAGWAAARLPWVRRNITRRIEDCDPCLKWLVVDGYGFHEGFFHWHRSFEAHAVPLPLSGYARRAFDQGLGRSLWFVNGADARRIQVTIGAFPEDRRGDLYSGIGLACAYAGGVGRDAVEQLLESAGPYWSQLAQGAAFAAKARQRAGNLMPHTELACQILCGMPADAAAEVTDTCLADLPTDEIVPAYEQWRRRIQARVQEMKVNFASPQPIHTESPQ